MTSRQFDVVVVGAGPAGSTAALLLARAGLAVALLERGEYPGAKNVSGAALHNPQFMDCLFPGFWQDAPVERHITRRVLGFMAEDTVVSLDFKNDRASLPPYDGFTVMRPGFDRWLARKAQEAGATVACGAVVEDLIMAGGAVTGVTLRDGGRLAAGVVIAADGVHSFLARKAGLRGELRPRQLALGVKEVVFLGRQNMEDRFALSGNEGTTYEFVGAVTGAAGGGGFLYTNRESVSIGLIVHLPSLLATRLKTYELLERFKNHVSIRPLLRGGVVREYAAHLIPEGGWNMLPRLFAPGLLVVGDAAGLVLATGYYLQGINYAMLSGQAAAETAAEAVRRQDYSPAVLAGYRSRLKELHVLPDLRTFARVPPLLADCRIQNLYPEVIGRCAARILGAEEGPKRKIGRLIVPEMKKSGLSWFTLLKDLVEGGRALIW